MGANAFFINSFVMRLIFLFMASFSGPSGVDGGIVLTAPAQGEPVTVSNEMVQNWWNNYKKRDGVKLAQKKEFCRPDPVLLKWEFATSPDPAAASDQPFKYHLYLSTDPDFHDMKNLRVFSTDDTSYKVYNLYSGRTYYWKVLATGSQGVKYSPVGEFQTMEGPRTLYVKGAYNTRDIGGYMTSSGRRVRQGLVYRSGNFDKIKDKGNETIRELGIKTQLDLRKDEGKVGVKTLPVDNYLHIRGHAYERIWKSERRVKRMVKIMRLFAYRENYPIVFHCIYGRDRAGTLAFLLSGMLGVSKYDLYRDYELTFLSKNSGSHGRQKIRNLDAFYKRLKNYKDPSQSLEYNIKAFLLDNGMTEEEIRSVEDIMLE